MSCGNYSWESLLYSSDRNIPYQFEAISVDEKNDVLILELLPKYQSISSIQM